VRRGQPAAPTALTVPHAPLRGQRLPTDRNLAQRAQWTRDRRVQVHLRPLTYRYERDATGRPLRDVLGKKQVIDVREKGVDVLVALALEREAADPNVGLRRRQ
jgi:hypothetical protein